MKYFGKVSIKKKTPSLYKHVLCLMSILCQIIVRPLAGKLSWRVAVCVISTIWLGSAVLAAPALLFSQEISFNL